MTGEAKQRGHLWRPLVVRGVPLHVVIPAGTALLGFGLMLAGGVASFIGGWLLAVGFPLAVGAFVADPRAIAAPIVVWAAWLIVVAATGPASTVPQTPPIVAIALAGIGTAATWLGQRAVQPAVEDPSRAATPRRTAAEFDALLETLDDRSGSPSLDPSAEVDEALAELLEAPIELAAEPTPDADKPHAQVEGDASPDGDTDTGHVIEFAALREEDLEP